MNVEACMRLRAWVSQVASSASRVSGIGCHQSNLIAVRGGQGLPHGFPLRQSAAPAIGHGAVLVVERLLSGARQRGVCKE